MERPERDVCIFEASDVNVDYLRSKEFKKKSGKLRGSVMLAGPMLARFKKAFIPKPGGDKIGRRRLDTHILSFEKLGAQFNYNAEDGYFHLTADQLKGTYILLDEPSVTGTANTIMAAVMAEGVTTIYNAACEPYIQQLCKMLNRMGAKISGIGSNLLSIEGVDKLSGTVLLLKRRDVPVWVLPGGGVEHHETPQEALLRETFEETGLQTCITRQVGCYFPTNRLTHYTEVYEATCTGTGELTTGAQTRALAFSRLITYLNLFSFYIARGWKRP